MALENCYLLQFPFKFGVQVIPPQHDGVIFGTSQTHLVDSGDVDTEDQIAVAWLHFDLASCDAQ